MTSAITARNSAWVVDVSFLPKNPSWMITNSSTAMASAFRPAAFQLGGLRRRASRALVFDVDLFSSAVGLRPVRPRDSIAPAALPRCLVRLLRFVWAMWTYEGR